MKIDARVLILSYELKIITKKFKFLKFNNKIRYQLWYLIDKDQFYFEKILNGKVIEYHHMKQNMSNSIKLFGNLFRRFTDIEKLASNFEITVLFDIRQNSQKMYDTINKIAKDVLSKNKSNQYDHDYLLGDDF